MLDSEIIPNDTKLKTGSNFLGILNDIKRRPEDAAIELDVSLELINSIINGQSELPSDLVEKATKVWPVNKRDFFVIEDDCPNGIKLMTSADSEKSKRTMERAGQPYYEYRDTAMSKVGPFRPEWIMELCNVDNNDSENKSIQWNNGHFMHQFTYFIGDVNFYYIDKNGKKQTAMMSTGDSMYITPFVPHTFATRNNPQSNGLILALTYGGKLTGEFQQELSSMSNLGQEFALDFSSTKSASGSILRYNREISTLTLEELSKRSNISTKELENFESGSKQPSIEDLKKIAESLSVNIRDLLPNDKIEDKVILKFHKDCKTWYYPETTKCYKFFELASTSALPFSKSFEVEILDSNDSKLDICSGLHQYVYNVGKTPITLNWKIHEKNTQKIINPDDSLYMKPFIKHNFRGSGKLLILRVGGKIPGDSQRELSIVGKENTERAISETTLWFDKKGKN
jgi:methylphosphonate synthase